MAVLLAILVMVVLLGSFAIILSLRGRVPGAMQKTISVTTPARVPTLDETGCYGLNDQVWVPTTSGVVHGEGLHLNQTSRLRRFLGIPFARRVPVGKRFLRPIPLGRFPSHPLRATQKGEKCAQAGSFLRSSSENCLYLDIWAPAYCNMTEPKTVVVTLVEDWFQTNSGNLDWSELVINGDVVLVSINHRMGVMGFLNPGLPEISGNMGIFDLLVALEWIRGNAAAFNGDPQNMVALGYGSGGAMLMFAIPHFAERYFKRAILQGLSPYSIIPLNNHVSGGTQVRRLAEALRCPDGTIFDNTFCLTYVNATLLLEAAEQLHPLWFVPSLDEVPIGFPPGKTKLDVAAQKLEVLCGTNQNDGVSLFTRYLAPVFQYAQEVDQQLKKLFQFFLGEVTNEFAMGLPGLGKSVVDSYGDIDPDQKVLSDFLTDLVFRCPMEDLAKIVSRGRGHAFHYVTTVPERSVFQGFLKWDDIALFAKTG